MESTALEEIKNVLSQNHIPDAILLAIGIILIALAFTYVKDKESTYYKVVYIVAIVAGIVVLVLDAANAMSLQMEPRIALAIACFAAVARPFRETHIAFFLGIAVLVIVYISLDQVNGISFLEQMWPKIAIAAVAAVIVYALCKFVEEAVQVFGKILNFWPVILVLGVLCITEAVSLICGYSSISGFFNSL